MDYKKNLAENHQRKLQRGLDNRHVQLIAIGGAIGTGLFMGSGKTISIAGPSIILVYAIIGCILYFIMRAMGELLLSNTQYRSFIDFSAHLLGPKVGFFIGWTYWLCWIVTGTADIIAIANYAQFWWSELNPWIPVLICIVFFLIFNLVAVKLFGELEFWFGLIKIVAILALIVIGFYMIFIGFTSPNGTLSSLRNVWNNGDIFPRGIAGFFAGFQISIFSFVGIELAGITAAEVKEPEKILPKAINSIPIRIVLFYIFSLIVIMSVTPWNQVASDKSPFVEMFLLVGIPTAAGLVNFIVLISAASSANSGIFSTSRMIYGLATKRGAPSFLGKLSNNYVPANALFFSCLCVLLSYTLLSLSPTTISAFTIITTIAAILFIFVWSIILISYITYRRNYPKQHITSTYKMPGGVFMCWVILAFFIFILFLLTLESDTLIALKYTPLWFVFLGIMYSVFGKKLY
ncbi:MULTISPECIES: amino acid permease [unclassified Bartonella]|uniref:amino acid permease n=1 Tax=unclassified Bartonella TaxID=2645622 RepID=UPI00099A5B64|nr:MULTISPECIES: amino acid permease [unclassified Bartonella]AQX27839.1 D-serine/D-alanine/glycine:proton symporter, AATfamily [Bartonella sp. JB15]AQX29119.1 D-serine/D-alanine/glycine:proton symporter, AATfamily [Bartonella sp. JB63]